MRRPRRVLWVRTDRLGETLLSWPSAASLKAALPEATVGCLVNAAFAPLAAHAPGIDHVEPYDGRSSRTWWARAARLAARLRPQRWDAALVANPMKELHLAVWLAGIPCRVGYDHKWSALLTRRVPDRKQGGGRHEVHYNLDLVEALGVPAAAPASWRLRPFESEFRDVRELLTGAGINAEAPFLAVHPWASTAAKRWPAARFRRLIERLGEPRAVQVVVVGGPEWAREAPRVVGTRPGVANLVGRLALPQLAALLERARGLVSADSGPVHLAAAVGTPTVVLFGTTEAATGPERWGPWGAGHRVIARPSMEAIEVEDVAGAATSWLACTPRGS